MMFVRPPRLFAVFVCSLAACIGHAQQPSSQPADTKQKQQQPAQQPNSQNPFENVPQAPEQPVLPQNVPQAQQPGPGRAGAVPDVIEAIDFRGTRRVPQDTLRALIVSRPGDKLDDAVLHRDFMALWNTGRLDDLQLEKEPGKTGWIIRFVVKERPVVRSITYEGNKSVSVSDILDRYKERKVGLSVESQYDPAKVQRAKNVLLELLSEHGRQFATVTPEIQPVPPSSLNIVFKVDEGPKVKVGKIDIEGNSAENDRTVIRSMKNLRPIGIPYSIFMEDLFPKSFDQSKLDEDQERVRVFYQEHGFFMARVENAKTQTHDTPGGRTMLFFPKKPGKATDIWVYVNEGHKYTLGQITFSGVKLFRTPQTLMRPLFQMSPGDTFSTAKLRKGIENMRKLYGEFGYIDFVVEPDPEPVRAADKVDLNLAVDEGKQFFVRRIDFSGNLTTRDKVIRRELLIDEGDLFNSRLWDLSILRLNQLGYFEPLKEEEAADIKRDTKTDTVDITLKVKERGKNSIQLNGGVSGIAGSFIGASYSTNNFLGLGETLSLSSQIGTMLRSVQFGFTEPYLFGKPMQGGFTIYLQRFNYNQGQEASILAGENLTPLYNQLGQQNLLNYVSNGYGFTTFVSYPLKRSFSRLGISYGYDISNITTLTTTSKNYFDYIDFEGVGGPNSLTGIRTSKITPSWSYNTVNHPITPTSGKSLYASMGFAGTSLGGNVNTIQPQVDAKYFRSGFKKGHVIGMHFLGRVLTGYGGKVAPPFSRFYMGGENDVRGFDWFDISPVAFIPDTATINQLNADGTPRVQRVVNSDGSISFNPVQQTVPIYRLVLPGGDTSLVGNFEYRIPIFGPVILAPFADAGLNKLSFANQLKLNTGRLEDLNSEFPQAGYNGSAYIVPGTQKLRTSTGLELQVLMPVVNAPFRVYWAYNPTVVRENILPPLAVDRSLFDNAATYNSFLSQYGSPIPYFERRSTFRFTIGRTF